MKMNSKNPNSKVNTLWSQHSRATHAAAFKGKNIREILNFPENSKRLTFFEIYYTIVILERKNLYWRKFVLYWMHLSISMSTLVSEMKGKSARKFWFWNWLLRSVVWNVLLKTNNLFKIFVPLLLVMIRIFHKASSSWFNYFLRSPFRSLVYI